MTIKAIETEYAGHKFRSRLEARWAVCFDELGIKWQYESQGYELKVNGKTRRYLPDFWLDTWGIWAEVKGDRHAFNADLVMAAANQLPSPGHESTPQMNPGIILLGNIPDTSAALPGFVACRTGLVTFALILDGRLNFVEPWHGCETVPGKECLMHAFDGTTDLTHPRDTDPAFAAARTARFEHGETPVSPSSTKQEADEILMKARRQAEQVTSDARARAEALERDAQERHRQAMSSIIGRIEEFLEEQLREIRAARASATLTGIEIARKALAQRGGFHPEVVPKPTDTP